MIRRFGPALLVLTFVVAYLFYLRFSSAELPARFATHFSFSGVPNGWSSHSSYLTTMSLTGVLMPLIMVVLMSAPRWIPSRFINIPHREYWLAPERREESVSWTQRHSIWLAILTVIFLAIVHHSILQANLLQPPRLSALEPMIGVALMLGGVLFFMVKMMLRFQRPPSA